MLADVPLNFLFSNEKPSEMYTSDEHRALMDDLKISKDSVSTVAVVFKRLIKIYILSRLIWLRIFSREKKKCKNQIHSCLKTSFKVSFFISSGSHSIELNLA